MSLTEAFARSVSPPASGSLEIPDAGPGAQRGLLLRVTSGGIRTWCARFSYRGARRRKVIGRVGEVPLRLARSDVAAIMAALAAGKGPEMVGTRDLDDLWAEFAAERRRALRRPDVDEALWANHAAPALGVLRPADMTADRYRRLVGEWTRAGAKPNTIRTRHRVVARFFAWLVERGHLTASPIPASPGVPRVERDRVPSLNEMRALWAWGAGAGTGGQVVRLILATGLRKQEAADLLWSEVEPDRLVIGAARMKGKRSHVVPLSRAARIVLAHQRARVGAWSLHVFPARRRGVETSRPTQAALSEAVRWSGVVEGVTVHDLRRGLATALGDAGVPPPFLRRFWPIHRDGSLVAG